MPIEENDYKVARRETSVSFRRFQAGEETERGVIWVNK